MFIVRTGDHTLLCIDEPFNHLGLPEIQPWLVKLHEYCDEAAMQSILISHHPESIDYLADEVGYWFEREGQKPTRVKKITRDDTDSGISISELIKRGWLYVQKES
jgi:ABC-type glutathione transport system ATPase component